MNPLAAARSARPLAPRIARRTSTVSRLVLSSSTPRFASSASASSSSSALHLATKASTSSLTPASRQIRRTFATATSTEHTPSSSLEPLFHSSAASAAHSPVVGSEGVQSILADTGKLLANDVGGSANWYDRIRSAEIDLEATRRGRLAVIGDPLAAPHDVVSAVLQDPLSDSEVMRKALLNRYFGTGNETLTISYDEKASRSEGHLTCPSGWLQASKYDVVEVQVDAPFSEASSSLVAADTVLVVLDPIRLASAPAVAYLLPLVLAKGNVHFVVNGTLPPHVTEEQLRARLENQIKSVVAPGLHGKAECSVSFVKAETALKALFALDVALAGQAGNKGSAFDVFQRDFLASNLGPLQSQLMTSLPAEYQLKTAACTAHLALAYTEGVIAGDRSVLSQAANVVTELRSEAHNAGSRAERVSVVARGIEGGVVEGSVEQSLDSSKRDLEHMFSSRFSWLGLVARLRVDDVAAELGAYLSRSFARDVERQLIFEAGELAQLQTSLGEQANKTARTLIAPHAADTNSPHPGHPFSSPLLLNHLQSLALSVPRVTPGTLLAPVTTRRNQLLATAVPRLQVAAQRSLMTTYALALCGSSVSWCACMPPFDLVSGYAALGTGALSIVGSLAMGQALWQRAQNKWWKDWNRVTDMMKDDLAETYDAAVEGLVLAQPDAAATGLSTLVDKRQSRLDDLERRSQVLHSRLAATGLTSTGDKQ